MRFSARHFMSWMPRLVRDGFSTHRINVQFRAEFFNVLNTRTYSGVGSLTSPATFGLATSAPNSNNPINGTGGPREVQLGLKVTF